MDTPTLFVRCSSLLALARTCQSFEVSGNGAAALKRAGRSSGWSLMEPTSTAKDHHPIDDSGVVRRSSTMGAIRHRKGIHEPAQLERQLAELGWSGWVRSSGKFFLYGCCISTA